MYVTNPHLLSRNKKFCERFNMQWLYYLYIRTKKRKHYYIIVKIKRVKQVKSWKIISNF